MDRTCDVINCVTVYSDIGMDWLRGTTETGPFILGDWNLDILNTEKKSNDIKYQ